jgi:hypothetical protein
MSHKPVEIPQLTLEQKWKMAETNLLYFVVSGIAYAKSTGGSSEDFGTFAGNVAAPHWEDERGGGPQAFIKELSLNKQQFETFQMEILSESERTIEARMRGFGDDIVRDRWDHAVTVDDYFRFFEKKWQAIADYLGLEYKQKVKGDWTVFIVSEKK